MTDSYSVEQTAEKLGISANSVRNEIRAKRLAAKKFSTRILIPEEAIKNWLENLPNA